ncbi:MAG: hypothetical protein COA44_10300 [Arcobacter sp.]|nr:MAG: hypothetical protein COA44_10300 [Arcobacter sp.]
MKNIINAYKLIQTIVDTQTNLVVLIEDEKPILMNKAFKDFLGLSSFEQYTQDSGSFTNNFVPHPSYFNADKVEEGKTWIESLKALDEKDKIVSMLSKNHELRAFSVKLDDTHEQYTVLSLEDISANLIKRIMIENDMNMDKSSGAYTKDYFLHTAEILQDGAAYNEKDIGLSMINFFDVDAQDLALCVKNIKDVIRENDILVKWSKNTLLLAYLTDKKDNAIIFTSKIHALMQAKNACTVIALVKKGEKIPNVIHKMKTSLNELNENEMKVL